jgi:hypothetical protein
VRRSLLGKDVVVRGSRPYLGADPGPHKAFADAVRAAEIRFVIGRYYARKRAKLSRLRMCRW